MIGDVLPATVRWADAFGDRDAALFAAERAAIAGAVPKRHAEFTTVRACARAALTQLGITPCPLVPGERGAPTWPEGVVGAMTHCAGYRAAAVARRRDIAAVGIDAEPNAELPDGLLASIARPEDLAMLKTLEPGPVSWDRVLFSAKESVYKAWFPVTREWLGFEDASVTVRADGTFTATIRTPSATLRGRPLDGFEGRWAANADLVVTAIVA